MLSAAVKSAYKIGNRTSNSYTILSRSSSSKSGQKRPLVDHRKRESLSTLNRLSYCHPISKWQKYHFSTETRSSSSDTTSGAQASPETNTSGPSSSKHKTSTTGPREERPVDPWKVSIGSWYTPELKRQAMAQQRAERDAALPKHVCSTPESLPYPSNDTETRLLSEMAQIMISTPPSEFASQIMPYWNSIDYYKRLSSGDQVTSIPDAAILNLQLPTHFQSLPAPMQASSESQTYEEAVEIIAAIHSAPYLAVPRAKVSENEETRKTSRTVANSTVMPINKAHALAEISTAALAQLLPAMVEADVYYAAEALTEVLRSRGVLELSATLVSSLNPRQTSALLPAMCRVNPTWREDGFFDLMVETLSTGGILRWEPSDVAAVLRDLPKVSIAEDYYTSPQFDPSDPANETKSPRELLQAAQQMAKSNTDDARWDRSSYGLPGDFLLTPSKQDVEEAIREYDDIVGHQETDSSIDPVSSSSPDAPAGGRQPPLDSNLETSSEAKTQQKDEDDDILAFLDVSHSVAPETSPEASNTRFEPAYYNPIAWQPEEIGRLVGTMLSQELELDDIVNVLSNLATDGWKDEANSASWNSYMGYFATVVSDALATNKHWVDEDYTWVLHDVITNVGPWALRQWPDYRSEEHQKWLAELVAQTAIKYGRFTHDYRLIQVMLNMICDNWPENEHQKLSDMIAFRMKDRTVVGRTENWFKWRVSGRFKEKFSDQRAAQSKLWLAPYNVGENPKLPELVQSKGLRELSLAEKMKKAIMETEDQKLTAPSRKGTKPNNELIW